MQFATAVRHVSHTRYEGNVTLAYSPEALNKRGDRIRARLAVASSRASGARRSWNGRRMPCACWHAYRDVMYAVYAINPEATIRTGMAVYRGLDGFERDYPGTGSQNIGSVFSPAFMPELCECSGDTRRGPELMADAGLARRSAPQHRSTPPGAGAGQVNDTAGILARMDAAIRAAESAPPGADTYSNAYTFVGSDMDADKPGRRLVR